MTLIYAACLPFLRKPSSETKNPDTATPNFQPIPGNGTCGYSSGVGYIVGGEDTVRGEIPFLAALGILFIK